jgi:Flp pilus assembly protein TadD
MWAVVLTNKAVALAHHGLYAEAVELFRQALDLDPRDVTAWTNHGLCLSRLGCEPEAFASFEKVRQLSVLTGFGISYGDDRNIQKYLFSLIA